MRTGLSQPDLPNITGLSQLSSTGASQLYTEGVDARASQGEGTASRQLARQLRVAITSGELPAGAKLPSERVLAADHNVARNTARAAVQLLADEGLVEAQHGRGVFVRERPRLIRFGNKRYSRSLRLETGLSPFHAEVELQGRIPYVDCVSVTRIQPPLDVAERLQIRLPEDTVARRENWYYADDQPIQRGVTYIPWPIAERSPLGESPDLGPGALYARFEERGYVMATSREEISARMPTPNEGTLLELPSGVPVLIVIHTSIDEAGRPFEVTQFTARADQTALDYSMPIEH